MFGYIIAIFIGFGLFYYFFIYRAGNPSFWKKVSKSPDLFYKLVSNNNAWVIDNGTSDIHINKDKYVGPFMLYVPHLNRTIYIYGEVGKYEENENILEKELDNQKG